MKPGLFAFSFLTKQQNVPKIKIQDTIPYYDMKYRNEV